MTRPYREPGRNTLLASGPEVRPIDRVLSRLSGLKLRNGYHVALCPAHDDHKQSLSVRERADESVGVKCFAGCATEEVLSAAGLTWRDLYPRKQERRYEWCVKDPDGNTVAIHHRRGEGRGKRVWWTRPDGTKGLGGLAPADLPLYRSEHSRAWGRTPVIVVEGEKAADALAGVYPAVLGTVTGAASTPSPETLRILEGRDVVLWADADGPGEAHMNRIARELHGAAQVLRMYEWSGAPPGGDAADHPAIRSGDAGEVSALLDDLLSAPAWEPEQLQKDRESVDARGGARSKKNQAERLIDYALEQVQELFVDQHGAPHALIDGKAVPLNSRCYSWLRFLMWRQEERAVSGEYLKTAAGTLAAHAEFSGQARELHVRAAWHKDVLYYELRPGRVVKVDAAGWDFEPDPLVLFRRFPNLKPLPDPERGGDTKAITDYANLKTDRDRRLFSAYTITVPLPHVGRPIFNASGAMGSGKTTIGRVVKRLLDPTAPESVRLDPRDFLQKASHAFVIMLDNQNTVPEWAADSVCRLVTGEADSKRRLYTDDEDVIVELRRAVLLNGINAPTDRGDVLDRSLVVELELIPDAERRTEEELWERFEAEHPRLLGALFDVLAQAIARRPSIELSRRPRLADWGEYAAAVYEVLGWGAGRFLEDWSEIVEVQNQSTLDGSPVAQAIIRFMEDREEYAGAPADLHRKLEGVAESLEECCQ
jgi:hypothetical protein